MKPNSFATQVIRPRDQFEAWREWYQPVLDVISKQPTGDEFPAEIDLWKMGGLAVSRTFAPTHSYRAHEAPSQARSCRSLGHQLLRPGCALRKDGGYGARSPGKSAVPLVVGTRILA